MRNRDKTHPSENYSDELYLDIVNNLPPIWEKEKSIEIINIYNNLMDLSAFIIKRRKIDLSKEAILDFWNKKATSEVQKDIQKAIKLISDEIIENKKFEDDAILVSLRSLHYKILFQLVNKIIENPFNHEIYISIEKSRQSHLIHNARYKNKRVLMQKVRDLYIIKHRENPKLSHYQFARTQKYQKIITGYFEELNIKNDSTDLVRSIERWSKKDHIKPS